MPRPNQASHHHSRGNSIYYRVYLLVCVPWTPWW